MGGRQGFLGVAYKEIQIVPNSSAFHGWTPFTPFSPGEAICYRTERLLGPDAL
jgi:hypothetical protein